MKLMDVSPKGFHPHFNRNPAESGLMAGVRTKPNALSFKRFKQYSNLVGAMLVNIFSRMRQKTHLLFDSRPSMLYINRSVQNNPGCIKRLCMQRDSLMKRSILSPLCSAFVVPGLGQIINQSLKKGLVILAIVFGLFVGGTVKLAFMIKSIINQPGFRIDHPERFVEKIQGEGLSSLWYLIIAFAVVWIYSVLDAFWSGKKLDNQIGGDSL
ncbi:MAG: hypothetical protein PVG99_09345 [Desulfobacteraceae bacterium]|jgi:hypothetical protein